MNVADTKSVQRLRRPTSRFRRYAAAAGSLALVGTLSLSGLVNSGGIEDTEAAWTDTEYAKTEIRAEWASGGWAKSTTSAYTNYNSFASRSGQGLSLDTGNVVTSPEGSFSAEYRKTGNSNFGPMVFGFYTVKNNRITGCAQAGALMNPLTDDPCTGGTPYAHPGGSQTRARSHGVSSVIAHPAGTGNAINWIIAGDVRTAAECRSDGTSSAATPVAGHPNVIRLRASSDLAGDVSDTNDVLVTPLKGRTVIGWMQPNYWSNGNTVPNYWRYSVTSRSIELDGYALSDLYVQVDMFRSDKNEYLGTHESVIARSECAVTTPSRLRAAVSPTFSPLARPSYPAAGLPKTYDIPAPLPDPTTGQVLRSRPSLGIQRAPQDAASTPSSLAVPTTSPLASATASDTTTSAPPDPSDEDADSSSTTTTGQLAAPSSRTATTTQVPTTSAATTSTPPATQTTTTTSAAPVIVVPGEPGDLAATARTEEAGTVEVDGDELVVVVKGDTVPSDTRTAPAALDTWINDRRQPSGDWTTFTSTEPDESGWRWAAINQETGTIVYIR